MRRNAPYPNKLYTKRNKSIAYLFTVDKLIHPYSEIIIDSVAFHPELESFVQGHENSLYKAVFSSQHALAQELWMEHWERSVEPLHNFKEIPSALLILREP